MLFKEYKKMYVEFCEEEIIREIVLAKRRYLRKEKALKEQCTLNEPVAYGSEACKIDMLVGDEDVKLEDFLPLEENIDNENISKNMKLLSEREKKVVSLRIEEGLYMKEINIYLGTSRRNTSIEIFSRAIDKFKKENFDEKKGE